MPPQSRCIPLAAEAQGQAGGLPEGPGKDLVAGICTGCHQTDQITRSSGYSGEHWKELIGTMIDLSPDQATQATITEYLAEKFPPNTLRAPKLMPGTIQVAFKEWQTPTLGQRTRDPVEAADGSIWWAGQFGNLIGRLNPATGEMKEYPLPANAKPHTITLDAQGIPWYSGNMNGTIGKVDPATGKVTEYKMPDPNAKDPHTIIFDKNGIAWFTAQNSNMIGRLDPATGEIKLVTAPVANAKPYGIKVDADGVLWVSCNGAPCLLKVDPATMAVYGSQADFAGDHRAAPRHRRGRHDLVRQLGAGPARPLQSEDRRIQGMDVAERSEVASLRHRRGQRHRLVQRVRYAARRSGAF